MSRIHRHCRWCDHVLQKPGYATRYPAMDGAYGRLRWWLCQDCIESLEVLFEHVSASTVQALIQTHRRLERAS